ncbi:MAG: CHAT domain-containing tetratricopeptide repeat protein [Pirellulaceae bacterium]
MNEKLLSTTKLAVCFALLVSFGLVSDAEEIHADWQRFHSLEGSFSIDVQSLPEVQVAVYRDRTITQYAFRTESVVWLATTIDYQERDTSISDETFTRKFITELADNSKAKIQWTKQANKDDIVGVRYAYENDEIYQLGQAIVDGDRMFTIARVSVGKSPAQWDEEDRLLNSFQSHQVDLAHARAAREFLLKNDAQMLMIQGLKHQQNQQWPEAVGVARIQAFLAYEYFGPASTDTASYVQVLGQSLVSVSRFDEAEAHLNLAAKIYATTKTDTLDQQVAISKNLAIVSQQTGRFDQAQEYLEKASNLAGKQTPPDASTQASIAYQKAKLALISGDPQRAYELALLWHEQAKKLPRKAAEDVIFATDMDDLQPQFDALMGKIQRSRGDLVAARRHLVAAIDGYSKLPEPRLGASGWRMLAAASRMTLGQLELDEENYTTALQTLSDAIVQLDEYLGALHPTTLEGLTDVAHCYERLGDFDKARDLFTQILEWRREVFGASNHAVASTLASLGYLEFRAGNVEAGYKHITAATELDLAIPPAEHPQLAAALQGRGNLLLLAKQYEAAARLFTTAKSVLADRNVETSAQTVPVMIGLGSALLGQKKYEAAEVELNAALTTAKQTLGNDAPQVALALEKLADVSNAIGNVSIAMHRFHESRQAMTQFVHGQMRHLDEQAQLKFLASEFQPAMHHAMALAATHKGDVSVRRTAPQWLINGKGVSIEALAGIKHGAKKHVERDWVSLEQLQLLLADDVLVIDILRLDDIVDDIDARYVAWVTQRSGDPQLVELGDANQIDGLIEQLRTSIDSAPEQIADEGEADAEAKIRTLLRQLATRLLQPCLDVTGSQSSVATKRIIVSPDSQTWMIPWDALVLDDGQYAIERFAIDLVTSGRDLVRGAEVTDDHALAMAPSLVLSDPEFGPSHGGKVQVRGGEVTQVTRLRQTAAEADAVGPLLDKLTGTKSLDLRRDDASESRIKQVVRPQVMHLATHGFFQSDDTPGNPLDRCGLMLAKCNVGGSQTEDGVLLGSEIVALDLRHTQLVVLSACDTGIGVTRGSEGVAGLRHAFHLAGVQAVVASLWKANDLETATLMKNFYSELERQRQRDVSFSAGESLRGAKLKWISDRRRQDRATHPVFWAAFDATGQNPAEETK